MTLPRSVFEYIEVDYNRNRRHSANGRISPVAFEELKAAHCVTKSMQICLGPTNEHWQTASSRYVPAIHHDRNPLATSTIIL